VPIARQAVELIIQGSPHSKVYRWLERKRRLRIEEEFKQEWKLMDE